MPFKRQGLKGMSFCRFKSLSFQTLYQRLLFMQTPNSQSTRTSSTWAWLHLPGTHTPWQPLKPWVQSVHHLLHIKHLSFSAPIIKPHFFTHRARVQYGCIHVPDLIGWGRQGSFRVCANGELMFRCSCVAYVFYWLSFDREIFRRFKGGIQLLWLPLST